MHARVPGASLCILAPSPFSGSNARLLWGPVQSLTLPPSLRIESGPHCHFSQYSLLFSFGALITAQNYMLIFLMPVFPTRLNPEGQGLSFSHT